MKYFMWGGTTIFVTIVVVLALVAILILLVVNYLQNSTEMSSTWPYWLAISILSVLTLAGLVLLGFVLYWNGTVSTAFEYAITNKAICAAQSQWCSTDLYTPVLPNSIADGFQKPVALFAAQTTRNFESTVKTGTHAIPIPSGCELVTWLTTSLSNDAIPVIGMVLYASNTNTCYVIYRGTMTSEEWQADLQFRQIPVQKIELNPTPFFQCNPNTVVHKGFLSVFNSFKIQLNSAITQAIALGADNIVISGHSLGGALASLSAVFVYSNVTQLPVRVYTFGKPRVGNIAYADCVNSNFTNRFYRVENSADLIPQLPFSCTPNLRQPSMPFTFQQEGSSVLFDNNLESLLLSHSLVCYTTFIESL